MLPLLALGRVMATPLLRFGGGIASKGIDLAQGAAKSAANQVDDELESQSNGSSGPPSVNTKGAAVNFDTGEEDTSTDVGDMFGGLDLAKVQSVIDDEGEMGPPEEGPKTVYKQMIQQLQNISQILLRTEATTKMLLAIDLERVRDTQSMDRQESVDLQDTDPPPPPEDEAGPGRFRRGVGAVGNMLGGAYSKVKSSLSGMLGIGALVLGFKFFREEIEAVTAKILEGFKAAYDYFTAEDFTMAKFQQDFGNIFWPKIQSIAMDFLDMLFTVVKESIFGVSGDRSIQQQTGTNVNARSNIQAMIKAGADFSGETFDRASGAGFQFKGLDEEQSQMARNEFTNLYNTMREISKESDGRIQFSGIDRDLSKTLDILDWWKDIPVTNLINAQPVIDGQLGTWESLKNINLDELAGIDRTMDEGRADKIRDVLRRKTEAYQAGQRTFPKLDAEYEALGPTKLQTLAGVTYTGQMTSQTLNGKNAILKSQAGPMTFLNASTNTGGNVITNNSGVHVSMDGTNSNQTVQSLNAMGYV